MWRSGIMVALVAAALAGCGSSDDGGAASTGGSFPATTTTAAPPTADQLDGRDFAARRIDGAPPVAGSDARIAFRDGRLGASTGCNGIGGRYEIADGRLIADELFQTEMGCEPALMRQEERMRTLLGSHPRIALDGRRLTLTGDDGAAIELVERDRPSDPPPIAGTRWTLETIAEGGSDGTASSVPAGVAAPTLLIGEDGAVELFAGCNGGGGSARVREGFVVFGPIALTRKACDEATNRVEATVTAILDGRVAASFEGAKLVLAKDGRQLVFTASR
ncbi:META domain-containing protein [Conexibacter arvalis]|uniref:Heat shock protein HslJ n=1 Tax=Conexibacter arvalis TaxID=912552 RepID=A0A840I9P9_9ACTN|nr:META domain-containing protein [Conexibacter arvalis]MBB4661322.1 heat shock protein HslJ [Conexibacter arvalis]